MFATHVRAAVALALGLGAASTASAEPVSLFPFAQPQSERAYVPEAPAVSAYAPASRGEERAGSTLRRTVVEFAGNEPAGTIVIDTPNTYLYYVLGNGRAVRYPIGVGREGFTWSGTQTISRKAEWPDWHPPQEMIDRQPYLPRFMAGGVGNPLGARAIYLGNTMYRIHGTNQPDTIGRQVSSGCIRMLNEDVIDLYERAKIGSKVVVLPARPREEAGTRRRVSSL
jgi:lipoprotein-anchoring transpeptidase ErfK/SrfK